MTARDGRRRNGSWLIFKRAVCAALILIACGVGPAVLGDGVLEGSWISSIGIDPTVFSLFPNDSYSELRLTYRLAGEEAGDPPISFDFSFTGEALFDIHGLHRLLFSSEGWIGPWGSISRLDLFPIAEEKSLDSTTQDVNHLYLFSGPWIWMWEDPQHLFGMYFREHDEIFIEWVKAENVHLTDPLAAWYIDISTDAVTWTTVAGPFDSATHTSGEVPVNLPVNYVRTRATAGFLDASSASPEVVTISVADRTFQQKFEVNIGGLTLESSMTLAETVAYGEAGLSGQTVAGAVVGAFCTFSYSQTDCRLSFQDAQVRFSSWQFFCVENVGALLAFGSSGFEDLRLSFFMETGLPWLDIRPELEFTLASKTWTLMPRFFVGETCVSIRGYWRSGTSLLLSDLFYQIAMQHKWEDMQFTGIIDPIYGNLMLGFSWQSSDSNSPSQFMSRSIFRKDSGALFDWQQSTLLFSLRIRANTEITTQLEFSETGLTDALLELGVHW